MASSTTELPTPPPHSCSTRTYAVRLLLVVAGLAAWFYTQALIGQRQFTPGTIGDYLLEVTAPINQHLHQRPERADALLIVSSAVIDFLGVFLLASSIFGRSIRPFLGLLLLFGLRQVCQGLCALPVPEGMIWRSPGFPTLLVTYGVSNDLFFSGHTAIAVFGAIEVARQFGRWGMLVAVPIVVLEIVTVLLLRAHYTMDVFTGAITALWIAAIVSHLAPSVDRAIGRVTARHIPEHSVSRDP